MAYINIFHLIDVDLYHVFENRAKICHIAANIYIYCKGSDYFPNIKIKNKNIIY